MEIFKHTQSSKAPLQCLVTVAMGQPDMQLTVKGKKH